MPADPNVYAESKPIPIVTPQQYELQRNDEQLKLADQRSKLQTVRDQAVARSVFARLGNDPEAALGELRRLAPSIAPAYEKQIAESRKAALESLDAQNKVQKFRTERGLEFLQLARATGNPAAYSAAIHNLAMDDEDAKAFPEQMPDPQTLDSMLEMGMSVKDRYDLHDTAIKHYADGDLQRGFAASLLSAGDDPEAWREALDAGIQMGVPKALVRSFALQPQSSGGTQETEQSQVTFGPRAGVDESAFQAWYARMAKRYGLNPNPDDPAQKYDYRSAFMAGATPDPETKHWPSRFKQAGHPNEIVGGFNTRTGERVPGVPRAKNAEELISLGWAPEDAKRLMALPEPNAASGGPTPAMIARAQQMALTEAQKETIRHNQAAEAQAQTTAQRQDAAQAETARHNRAMEARPVGGGGAGGALSTDDTSAIADAIIRGEQPPVLTGLYSKGAAVRAALAKKGYNLADAQTDWTATQKHLATLNGAQQTRMRQAVDNAYHSLDVIEDLAKQWDGGRFPLLNKASLAAAKNGAMGKQAQQIATQLEAQISDVTSELGNVYMGGNSPTDHALSLAAKNLSANWSKDQLLSALSLARKNLQIRTNSMNNVSVAGVPNSQYMPAPGAAPAPPTLRFNPKTGKVEPIQ